MKRFFVALVAAAMLCCTLVTPAAAETYKKGDVNMDGVVDLADALLVLREYARFMVGYEVDLSEEQIQLAAISGYTASIKGTNIVLPFSVTDAQTILNYYTECTLGHNYTSMDIEDFFHQIIMSRA